MLPELSLRPLLPSLLAQQLLLLALVSPASQGASSDAKKPLMSPPPVGCRERGLCWNCGSSHGRPWLEQETGQQLEDSRFYSQKAVVPQTKEPCIPGSPLGHLKTEAATEDCKLSNGRKNVQLVFVPHGLAHRRDRKSSRTSSLIPHKNGQGRNPHGGTQTWAPSAGRSSGLTPISSPFSPDQHLFRPTLLWVPYVKSE
ncbi:uncharacterized protein LOC125162190 isoform X2 [Prionailurus viverrinus]|uniref:uncharacterized protein LOC125162190 isoform X2 n=1 Tax=Prionailurus viverrinus TaxID=61388 RepID=UPI001FF6F66A|nr:uncharacterized protein LOC125162190 isoform X2 [Prionailurus viverrinus]